MTKLALHFAWKHTHAHPLLYTCRFKFTDIYIQNAQVFATLNKRGRESNKGEE